MNALGLVVEYNPFHNGHFYHLAESKKETNADVVIAVMSGNFLQRGEPALISKWERTKMALHCGIDLVIELPYAFATQKANTFANGAVSILEALKCQSLCFGSELGEISSFLGANEFLHKSKQQYDELIKKQIKTGVSYPTALTNAFQELTNGKEILDLSLPNNILGFHYVKSIREQQAQMKPFTIQRTSAGYHEQNFVSPTIASATSIRKSIFSNEGDITNYVPSVTFQILNEYKMEKGLLHNWEQYFHLLKYSIMTMTEEDLLTIYEVEEGLENRIKKNILHAQSFQDFMERIKTKRYTWTRLQRLCTHILTKTTKQQMSFINDSQTAPYIRLLGMSSKGQEYLRSIKKQIELPIISKLATFRHPLLELDIKATNTYNMIFEEPLRSKLLKAEYATPPIRL
ncbi:nucleotidyltransferase [Metabacillus rhizolycopersici]|uniref:tRNA(Met) cytidine acetate ligase n=1 Tax=Metabacillus rhizolycopersici TaxID=2875709 RepID=A0ABS7UK90_9BACI|nr:nucleotidyltransferase [Metabacillus rhizolycopersici]MBZ5748723.1 nucleotidyltransferase [Metabacillus rhizolycopersici]